MEQTLSRLETILLQTLIKLSSSLKYSRVHISWNEVFSKILKKPSIVQKKMMPHMKAFGLFNKMKQKSSKWPPKKKGHFPAPPILNIFL